MVKEHGRKSLLFCFVLFFILAGGVKREPQEAESTGDVVERKEFGKVT